MQPPRGLHYEMLKPNEGGDLSSNFQFQMGGGDLLLQIQPFICAWRIPSESNVFCGEKVGETKFNASPIVFTRLSECPVWVRNKLEYWDSSWPYYLAKNILLKN